MGVLIGSVNTFWFCKTTLKLKIASSIWRIQYIGSTYRQLLLQSLHFLFSFPKSLLEWSISSVIMKAKWYLRVDELELERNEYLLNFLVILFADDLPSIDDLVSYAEPELEPRLSIGIVFFKNLADNRDLQETLFSIHLLTLSLRNALVYIRGGPEKVLDAQSTTISPERTRSQVSLRRKVIGTTRTRHLLLSHVYKCWFLILTPYW